MPLLKYNKSCLFRHYFFFLYNNSLLQLLSCQKWIFRLTKIVRYLSKGKDTLNTFINIVCTLKFFCQLILSRYTIMLSITSTELISESFLRFQNAVKWIYFCYAEYISLKCLKMFVKSSSLCPNFVLSVALGSTLSRPHSTSFLGRWINLCKTHRPRWSVVIKFAGLLLTRV